MSLNLIPVLIHTPEIVRATMNVEHYSLTSLLRSLPSLMVGLHLDPLRPQAASIPTPLPPLASSNFIDAFVAQLRNDGLSGTIDSFLRHLHLLCSNPMGAWDPLRCEGLDVLDCVIGGIVEEASNQLKAFVVRYVRRWFLAQGFAIQILPLYQL